jgi:hypothetical protein
MSFAILSIELNDFYGICRVQYFMKLFRSRPWNTLMKWNYPILNVSSNENVKGF